MTVSVLGRRLPAAATYTAALGAALILLLLAASAAFWTADQLHATNAQIRRSYEIRSHMRFALSALQDAETGQRGYLLTGREPYLEPYIAAGPELERRLSALARITEDDPDLRADAARLRSLANLKIGELEETIALYRAGHHAQAAMLMQTDRGKQYMDEARALVEAAFGTEGLSLDSQLLVAERSADRLRLIVAATTLMLLAIGVLLFLAVFSAMRELRASRDSALTSANSLAGEMERRRQSEAAMLQMQKMEAIGQLTGGVAHDFNNMLAVIISALTLAQRRLARGDQDVQRFIEAAHDGARRAATLTSRLLAFARRQPLTPAVIETNRLVGGMSELLRRTLGETIEMETVLAGGLWRVYANSSQLENAIVNICINARDAMAKSGGKLTIETANAFLDAAYAAANPEVTVGQYVMIAITDTGEGMGADVIARAFEPFFTTKEVGQGTGLGLSHVHGFLKQTGGHVSIYSELGHGTTVKLYLPRSQRVEDAAPAPSPQAEAPMGDAGTLILVAEDDERVRTLSVASLRELGYTVQHAQDGASALKMLDANPGIHLLFTDIVMPDMSGRKLADEARTRHPKLKVLYTTGYTQNAIVHNGVVDADARLLLKPYSMEDLARKVRAVLDES